MAPILTTLTYCNTVERLSPNEQTKSYLDRPDPVRQQSQARRRSLIKKSLQIFLAGDDKENVPRDETIELRGSTTSRRERTSNYISSVFLSPRQKQRAKALNKKKTKDKNNHERGEKTSQNTEKEKRADLERMARKQKLCDSQETTALTVSSSVGSRTMPPGRSNGIDNSKLHSPMRLKKYGIGLPLSPTKYLSPRRKKVVIPEDGVVKTNVLDNGAKVQKLPFVDEIMEDSQTCFGYEEKLDNSAAINFIDGTDWAHLEWNVILPSDDYNASISSSRSDMPRRRRSTTHAGIMLRRASCHENPNHDRARTKDSHLGKCRSVRNPREVGTATKIPRN
jgi:hypothetical protein